MKRDTQQHSSREPFIRAMYRGNHAAFIVSALAATLIGAINLWIAWLMQQMVDAASGVEGAMSLRALIVQTAAMIASILLLKAAVYLSQPRFMERAMRQYKAFAFERIITKRTAVFGRENTSAYLSALTHDVGVIESDYLETQYELLQCAVKFVCAVAMMLAYSPLLTAVGAGFALLPMAASMAAGSRLKQAQQRVSQQSEGFLATMRDMLGGFSVIRSFGAEKAAERLFGGSSTALEEAKASKCRVYVSIGTISSVAAVTAQLGVFLTGACLAAGGFAITPGTLIIFVDLMNYVLGPIRELPGILAGRRAALALVDRLAALLEEEAADTRGSAPARLETGIELRNLSFAYEPGKPVLSGLCARFCAGGCYAVVGASGSGKSTLLQLLTAGREDYAGEILLDGRELRTLNSESLVDLMSVVEQNVFVFNASIRENITMFASFDEEQVSRAIALSGLSELMEKRGGDFLCGENGCNLSGGEKQRIAIARSLLHRSGVLLMDEATSALDTRTGRQVLASVQGLESMTRIVVTHSLDEAFLRGCDGIAVLRGGCVEEQGTYEALMERKGYFYSLYTVCQSAA